MWFVEGGVAHAMVVAAVLKKEVKQEETRMVTVKTERSGTVAAVMVKKEIEVNKKKRASTTHVPVRDGGQPRPAFHSGHQHSRRAAGGRGTKPAADGVH